jgi:hypothetical protein
LGQLLGYRACTLYYRSGLKIIVSCPDAASDVKTEMLVEAFIFDGNKCLLNMFGDFFQADCYTVLIAMKRSNFIAVDIIKVLSLVYFKAGGVKGRSFINEFINYCRCSTACDQH